MLLAGDVGGTKTNLALYSVENGARSPVAEKKYLSDQYPSLEAMVRDFLGETHEKAEKATFGVAGPVVTGKAEITNLPWEMDEKHLEEALELKKVRLINDLQAIAYGVPILKPDELSILQEGRSRDGGTIAVIAPGTGLGESFMTWDGNRYRAQPSEGGHTDFAPTTPLELGLLRYLQERIGHVSYERVCSGRGFPNIYNYLRDMSYAEEPSWLIDRLAKADDPTPIIVNAALDDDRPCDLCRTALMTFVSVLGAEAGNLALKVLAMGGVYLGGGIPPKIHPVLKDGTFINAFRRKGRFGDLMSEIPVKVILNPKVALLGAACHVIETENSSL